VTDQLRSRRDSVAATYPAVPDSVPRARRAVVDLAAEVGASPQQLEAIRLAVSEALSNAVIHAYPGAPGQVHVRAAVKAGVLSVVVADEGRGLSPKLNRRGMGLGLVLIAQAADELTIAKRSAGGTELQMRFAVSPRS
jgi:anti-sigma regulatory factor (Ser/Thr protein kinase)